MKTFVRPTAPFCIEWDGILQTFNPDRLFDPEHPLVKAHPTCFEPAVPHVLDRVEQATAAPGELRNARR